MSTALTTFKPQQANLVNLENPTTIETIKASICKGASNEQLSTFLTLAKHFNLNPFNKEIYFSSQIGVFVGRHGKLRIANRHPEFRGLNSCEIREKDDFQFDAASNKIVKHITGKNMGKIIGAWATGKRKGFDDITVICWLDEYKKENPAWKNYTQDLIKYKAEDRVLRTLFNSEYEGINTVDPEDEFITELRPTFAESHSPAVQIPTLEMFGWKDEEDSSMNTCGATLRDYQNPSNENEPSSTISNNVQEEQIEEPEQESEIAKSGMTDSEIRIEFQTFCKNKGLKTTKQLQEFVAKNRIDSQNTDALVGLIYDRPEELTKLINEFLAFN